MSYIWLAIASYICFGMAGIGDKVILSKVVRHPLAYAFYVGILSPVFFLFAPAGLHLLSPLEFLFAILGGIAYTYALIFLYRATNSSTPSRSLTLISGLQPILVFCLAWLIAGEHLSSVQLTAFAFLVAGSVLVSFEYSSGRWQTKILVNAFISALLFAVALAFIKHVYNHTNFVSGIVWTRFGLFVGAASLMLIRSFREQILSDWRLGHTVRGKVVFATNFTLGSAGAILQNYAISLGSVSIVSAMGGLQLVFVLIFGYLITKYASHIFSDEIHFTAMIQKILAICLICVGLALLNVPVTPKQNQRWGIEFSPQRAAALGLDPNVVLANINADLNPPFVRLADNSAVDLNPVWYNRYLGFYKMPVPAQIYRLLHPKTDSATIQGDPTNFDLDLASQKILMNQKVLEHNIHYAQVAGFSENSLTGAEWWYYLAVKEGDYGMWAQAKEFFASNNPKQ